MAPVEVEIGDVHVAFTGRAEGDLGPAAAGAAGELERRRRAVVDRPWSWARQVHGTSVAVVRSAGEVPDTPADVLVTDVRGVVLATFTADCAPVTLVGEREGAPVIASVHAGWRGLARGVIEVAATAVRRRTGGALRAAVGPCIHAECYAFSPADLDAMAARLGDGVRSVTRDGSPALDLPAALQQALSKAGIELVHLSDICTGCDGGLFSHRVRGERERQAMVAWAE